MQPDQSQRVSDWKSLQSRISSQFNQYDEDLKTLFTEADFKSAKRLCQSIMNAMQKQQDLLAVPNVAIK